MAFSSSAYKDVQGHVQDIAEIPWNAKSRRYFHFKLQQDDEETGLLFYIKGN